MGELTELDKKNIWHPFTPLTGGIEPLFIDTAQGVYLHTSDGKKIIDAVSSWWVNLHGHSNPAIANAIADQAKKLEHVIFAGFTHEPAIRLSQNLLSILPANQAKVFFSDNGSTAVEVALKMAIQYWRNQGIAKRKIVAIEGAYHGDTFGSMSVGDRGIFTEPFFSYLFDVGFIPFPSKENEATVIKKFEELLVPGEVAAFVFEPLVQAAAGMRIYPASILDKLISIAQQHNVICIADEVFTGFGRTGKLFACDHLAHKPDIITLSKGITGGFMPLGVTTCSEKISAPFRSDDFLKTFFHGHSYTANPLACAAANASFNLLIDDTCARNIHRISRAHENFSLRLQTHKRVQHVRSMGTILAVELRTTDGSSYENELRKKIYPYFLERGILLRPLGNIIYVLPPYIITDDELAYIYTAIESFLDA
jgi:adenosylmethionine---8-amino-7-oxononanoate aminotransferase